MGVPTTPRSGNKSAPSDAPAPRPVSKGPSVKSAPTEAPAVRSTLKPRMNGTESWETPTSVKSNVVDQKEPVTTGKDPNIERIA